MWSINQILNNLGGLTGPMNLNHFMPHSNEPFIRTYRVFPVAAANKDKLEAGDKIILPSSALDYLVHLKVQYPMLFSLLNKKINRKTHCGVMEFSSEEGVCYLPFWMMQNLLLETGDFIEVANVQLPKGTFVKLQPHTTAFTKLTNPRVVLEKALRNFTCLSVGDTIAIQYGDENFYLDVTELKPKNAVTVIETDINVDFDTPKDFKEDNLSQINNSNNNNNNNKNSNKNNNSNNKITTNNNSSTINNNNNNDKPPPNMNQFHFSHHESSSGHLVSKEDFNANGSKLEKPSENLDYFAKLGGGYKLKNGKSMDDNKNGDSKNSNNSDNKMDISNNQNETAKKYITEIIGNFEYYYEVDGNRKRLIKRVAVTKPTTQNGKTINNTNNTATTNNTSTNKPSSNNNNTANNKTTTPTANNNSKPSVFSGKGHSLK